MDRVGYAPATGLVGLAAVCDQIDALRDKFNAGVRAALDMLDGTDVAAVAIMTRLQLLERLTHSAVRRSRTSRSSQQAQT